MGTIDVWAQITTERMAKRAWLETLLRWTGRAGEYLLPSVESTLSAMNEAGVDIALLSAWATSKRTTRSYSVYLLRLIRYLIWHGANRSFTIAAKARYGKTTCLPVKADYASLWG